MPSSLSRLAVVLAGFTASCGKIGYEAPSDAPGNVSDVSSARHFVVGSFARSATSGTQIVAHGLGGTPKALLLFTAGKARGAPSPDYMYAVGASDGPGSSRSIANASQGGASPSRAARRMAARALSVVDWSGATSAEADLSSWDTSSFTLAWTARDAATYAVHYVVIGGASVSAKVVSWQAPTSPTATAIGGIGFRPDTALHFHAGALFVGPVPASLASGALGMGAFDAAGHECAWQVGIVDGRNPTMTARALRSDATIYMFSELPTPNVTKLAALGSIDADGFTLDFRAAEASPTQIFSLALGGVAANVGAFDKTTEVAPVVQSVTRIGFEPELVLLASVEDVVAGPGVSRPHARLTVGASDGVNEASSEIDDFDGVAPSRAFGADDTGAVFRARSRPGPTAGTRGAIASFDPDGFSLALTANDRLATRIGYWALRAR